MKSRIVNARKVRPYSLGFVSAAVVIFLVSGCSSSRNGVSITERPERAANIITEAVQLAEPVVDANSTDAFAGVEVGRFDGGKMWTFDNPPLDYFSESYGLEPDSAWFAKARLGALRFSTFCSASFVSPHGLILTNHHCARSSVTDVSRTDEALLDNGFYATSTADERLVEDLYVEQLVHILDVTDQVYSAMLEVAGAEPPAETRRRRAESIQTRLQSAASARDSSLQVQVIALYDGGKYAAYTFKRYDDIRLVFSPELQIGFFGGDHDNFTYPRYNLDMSLFRAYDSTGEPLTTPEYFSWSTDGARQGDAVFVVGNPGSTSRTSTISQLEYVRDYALPQSTVILQDRSSVLAAFTEEHSDVADEYDVRNDYFSVQNSLKAELGQLEGLREGKLIRRRGAAEEMFVDDVAASDSLTAIYGSLLADIDRLQVTKQVLGRTSAAFAQFLNPSASSHILTRALYGYVYELLTQRGAPPEQLRDIRRESLEITDWPRELERRIIARRMSDLQTYLGDSDPTIRRLFSGTTPEALADSLALHSALADSSAFRVLLDDNYLASEDISVEVINAIAPLFFSFDQQQRDMVDREETLEARLARARFALYGDAVPPDASFSLRIADGIVSGYAFNGTVAPAFTTFYGLYDLAYSHHGKDEWDLPERWKAPPSDFDYNTPMNLVTTNDITGGNSGSPLLNARLEIVGLVFDGNIESLPNEFMYSDVVARTISVDSRGMLEALDAIYNADRLVHELVSGELVRSESEMDENTKPVGSGK